MKTTLLKTVLYIMAAMMVAGWIVSILFFVTGMFIHILLLVALFLIMQGIIITPRPQRDVIK